MKRMILAIVVAGIFLSACTGDRASHRVSRTESGSPSVEEMDHFEAAAPSVEPMVAKMIESWSFRMETDRFDETFQQLEQLIEEYRAITDAAEISNQNLHATDPLRYARLSLRVDAEMADSFVRKVRDAGHVVNEHHARENVAEQIQDGEARREMLQTKENRLKQLLNHAETVEDLITIEEHLSETIAEKERILSTLAGLEKDVQYRHFDISLQEVVDYTKAVPLQRGFVSRLGTALRETGAHFLRFLQDIVITLIYALPYLLLLGIGTVLGIRVLRMKKRQPLPVEKKKDDSLL